MNQDLNNLIERFADNEAKYKSSDYNETQARIDFINPLFKLLGWDINNEKGYAEQYREVFHEDAIKVAGSTKSPDYSFRIGGQRKFFLEAKKPSVNIKDDIHPAYQLRRYAWSSKLPLSILTDFEEFAVYDCRIKPNKTDKSSVARIFYCKYSEFPEKWDYISSIFSKEAILKGSFDKYAESNKRKKGTAEVDDAFLQEMESWRDALARNIALRNKEINIRQLNELVQKTIDRIVFLRICEDRGIEQYGQLQKLLNVTNVYNHLCEIFLRADDKYNSGLFHFKKEKDRPDYDDWSLEQTIDDKVLKEILKRLYYPDSPYEFSVLPSDILGQVYERFLGKVIRLTAGHQAKIEEKPEVRKAGGVYYTPTYIVDYIVKNTIGRKLGVGSWEVGNPPQSPFDKGGSQRQGDSEFGYGNLEMGMSSAGGGGNEVDGGGHSENTLNPTFSQREKEFPPPSGEGKGGGNGGHSHVPSPTSHVPSPISQFPPKLTILDPACGSGSFLLGAYQFLLDWYLEQYSLEPEKYTKGKEPKIYQTKDKLYKLAIQERKRILLDHIYGVDIDSQAVEVTKLSLLLKVLEGETEESLGLKQLTLKFRERALPDLDSNIKCGNSLIGPDFYDNSGQLFDEEEMYRINTFDWEAEFPHIFGSRNLEAGSRNLELPSPNSHVPSPTSHVPSPNSQKGFDVVIGNPPYGSFLDEVNKKYLNNNYEFIADYETSQYFIYKNKTLLSKNGFFGMIIPNTFLLNLFAKKIRSFLQKNYHVFEIVNLSEVSVFNASVRTIILFLTKTKFNDNLVLTGYNPMINFYTDRIFEYNKFVIDEEWINLVKNNSNNKLISKIKNCSIPLNNLLEISQGLIPYDKYRGHDEYTIKNRIWNADIKKDDTYKKELRGGDVQRYSLKWNGVRWLSYGNWLAAPRKPKFFNEPRLLFREITDSKKGLLHVTFSNEEYYNNPSIINCIKRANEFNILFLLGICASKSIAFFHFNTSPKANKGVFPKILVKDVRNLPIRTIDFSIPEEKAMHDKMVELVERMLELNKRVHSGGLSTQEKKVLENQIQITDRQIDTLVYKLYDLTEEEIRIVEEGV